MVEFFANLAKESKGRLLPGVVDDDRPLLVLYYTLLCNATCKHCIVESGPKQVGRISKDTARHAIEGASRCSDVSVVVFTGGESFIYLSEILDLCQYAKSLGLRTRIVTNGYWARTPDEAARMIERIVRDGVDELFVSFDEFHLAFIAPERILNIFLGAQRAAVLPYVLYATVIDPDADSLQPEPATSGFTWPKGVVEILKTYGFPLEICVPQTAAHEYLEQLEVEDRQAFKESMTRDHPLIAWQTLGQAGRASRLMKGRMQSRSIDEDSGSPCSAAGRLLTVPTNGNLYPCCSAWTNFDGHHFGHFNSATEFADRRRTMAADSLVRFIHEQGPGKLIRSLRARGHALPERYTDICNMCEQLFSTYSLDQLRAEIDEVRRTESEVGIPI
jgi:hypothetical protein